MNEPPALDAPNLLKSLAARPRVFAGRGVNHEGEEFLGRLELQPLVDGAAVVLHYTATGLEGRLLHREATLLGAAEDARLCLWPVMDELPAVLAHREVRREIDAQATLSVVFATGPRDATATFREEILLALHADGRLTYGHSWGLPGGAFAKRSSCELAEEKS